MFMSNEQEQEIKSIKERNITIKLSDADTDKLIKKAGTVGLTVSQLLENFIGDLVDGTYSNGSDERMYANDWFERCWFSMGVGDISFLQWLIINDCIDDAVLDWNTIQALKITAEEDDFEKEETTIFRVMLQESFDDMFNDYKECQSAIKDSTLDSEMEKVVQWSKELKPTRTARRNFSVK